MGNNDFEERDEAYHAARAAELEEEALGVLRSGEPIAGLLAVSLARHLFLSGSADRALDYLGPALDHLEQDSQNSVAVELLDHALEFEDLLDPASEAALLLRLADRLNLLGRREGERASLEKALPLTRSDEDALTFVQVRQQLGQIRPHEEGLGLLEEAVAEARRSDLRREEAVARGGLGGILADLGRFDSARDEYHRQLGLAREIDDREQEAAAEGNLALIHWRLGRIDEALRRQEACLSILRELSDRRREAQALGNLGLIQLSVGRAEEARRSFAESLWISRERGYRRGEGMALGSLGLVSLNLGRYREAGEYLTRNLTIARELENPFYEATSRHCSGVLWFELGRMDDAKRDLEEALSILKRLGRRHEEANVLASLAGVHAECGEHDQAEEILARALAIHQDSDCLDGIARVKVGLARLRMFAEQREEARFEVEEALQLMEGTGVPSGRTLPLALLRAASGGDVEEARRELFAHEGQLEHGERIEAHYWIHLASGEGRDLEEARHLLRTAIDNSPPDCRRSLAENRWVHRRILAQ